MEPAGQGHLRPEIDVSESIVETAMWEDKNNNRTETVNLAAVRLERDIEPWLISARPIVSGEWEGESDLMESDIAVSHWGINE